MLREYKNVINQAIYRKIHTHSSRIVWNECELYVECISIY